MSKLKSILEILSKRTLSIFLFCCAIVLSVVLIHKMNFDNWRYAIYQDGRGYYSYLPALLIYNDPSCSFYKNESVTKPDSANFINYIDGKPVNKYFCGVALLQLPFFSASHIYAKLSGENPNGYSKPYQWGVALAALFYFLAGLFFLWKFLEKFNFGKWIRIIVCICFAFGTNLFHYAVFEPSMSHVYSFAAISAFLFSARSFFLFPSTKKIIVVGIILGIIALLRPANLLILFSLPLVSGNLENLKNGFSWMKKNSFQLLTGFVPFVFICSIQLFLYKWQTGHYLVWSYKDEGFNFLHPHVFGTLFSYEKGLFIYTPMTFLSLFGLIFIFKRSRFLFLSLIFVMAVIIYVVSSWHEWKYGFSFGLRAYLDFYTLFAFSFAFLIDAAMKRKMAFAICCLIFSSILVFSNIQEYQYDHRIIHGGAMNKENYWLVFLQTNKKYQDTISIENYELESSGIFNDMEGSEDWPGKETIIEGTAYSGNHSSRIDSASPYSVGFNRNLSSDDVFDSETKIQISAWVMRTDSMDKGTLVIAQQKRDSIYFRKYIPLPSFSKPGEWVKMNQEIVIPSRKMDNEYLKIFFTRFSGTIYIDDFNVEIFSAK